MVHLPTAAAPTRTTKVSTRTSKPIPNQKSAKNLILTIKVVAQIAMLKWTMQKVMVALRRPYQNVRRRSKRPRKCEVTSPASAKGMGQKDLGTFPTPAGFPAVLPWAVGSKCSVTLISMRVRFFAFPLMARETLLAHRLEFTPPCTIGWQRIRRIKQAGSFRPDLSRV